MHPTHRSCTREKVEMHATESGGRCVKRREKSRKRIWWQHLIHPVLRVSHTCNWSERRTCNELLLTPRTQVLEFLNPVDCTLITRRLSISSSPHHPKIGSRDLALDWSLFQTYQTIGRGFRKDWSNYYLFLLLLASAGGAAGTRSAAEDQDISLFPSCDDDYRFTDTQYPNRLLPFFSSFTPKRKQFLNKSSVTLLFSSSTDFIVDHLSLSACFFRWWRTRTSYAGS